MAFRQFRRFGKLLSGGRVPAGHFGCMILEFGPCPRQQLTSTQSVIFQQVLGVHTRTLSSIALPNQRNKQSSSLSNNQLTLLHQCSPCNVTSPWGSLGVRHFSLQSAGDEDKNKPARKTIFQRFKETYKEYGKVLIGVHVATSAVWLGTFYYAAYSGIDIVPLLEKLGFGEKVVSALGKPGVGHIAVAYLLYKIATPARYTVTIVGTQMTVKQLRKLGYLQPIKTEDSLRSLFKEGSSQVKERYGDMKVEIREKMVTRRENFTREFHTQRERFRTRHSKLRRDIERRAKLRNKSHYKNGRNGHPKV